MPVKLVYLLFFFFYFRRISHEEYDCWWFVKIVWNLASKVFESQIIAHSFHNWRNIANENNRERRKKNCAINRVIRCTMCTAHCLPVKSNEHGTGMHSVGPKEWNKLCELSGVTFIGQQFGRPQLDKSHSMEYVCLPLSACLDLSLAFSVCVCFCMHLSTISNVNAID